MSAIKIISGDFIGTEWNLNGNKIHCGFYHVQEIPLSEIVGLVKKENFDSNVLVLLLFSDNKKSMAMMKSEIYSELYTLFLKHGNSPQGLNIPISRKNMANMFLSVFGVLLISGFILNGKDNVELTNKNKVDLCKSYISELFGQPVNIMKTYMVDGDMIYVEYIRSSDRTEWRYVCNVSNHQMVWAGWLNDTKKWGRWRFEDEVDLSYDNKTKSITYRMLDTGKIITVK